MSATTAWRSATTLYNSSTGAYTGSTSTNGILGEWLQINLGATYSIRHYSLSIGIADFNKIPVSWSLLASNDGSLWSQINAQTLSLTASPASLVGNKYVVFFTMSDTYASSHQYYRFVFQSILGAGSTQVQIGDIDLFVENPNHVLRAGTSISMTKNWFQTSVFTGYSNIVQYKTLTNVPITNDVVNSRYLDQVNLSIQNKTTSFVQTSYSYNGEYSVLTDFSNSSIFYAKDFSNNSFSSATTSTMTNKYSSCYNGTFFLVGGNGTDKILYSHPSDMNTWYPATNANDIFSGGSVLGLFCNSGFDFVSPPNSLYIIPGEKLSITAPKSYDHNMQGKGVAFSFNMV